MTDHSNIFSNTSSKEKGVFSAINAIIETYIASTHY